MKKIILIMVGSLLTLNAVVISLFSNMTVGNIVTLLLGLLLLLWGVFIDTYVQKVPRWIKHMFVAGIAVVVIFVAFLLGYGLTDNVTYDEDAIIVLGAGVHGERLSETLKDRLDCALKYHSKNPDAVIIVSGGQGPQEDITEALAMERYLLSQGVPAEKIIKEEKSTSTYENFKFSRQLLDEHFTDGYKVAFISNEYHIYRAGSIAEREGYEDLAHYHSNTKWYTVIPGVLRECLAVIKFLILKK